MPFYCNLFVFLKAFKLVRAGIGEKYATCIKTIRICYYVNYFANFINLFVLYLLLCLLNI